MDLGPRQRENLSKALYDIGKLALAFIVLGPLASPTGVRPGLALVGLLVTLVMFASAIAVDKGGKQK